MDEEIKDVDWDDVDLSDLNSEDEGENVEEVEEGTPADDTEKTVEPKEENKEEVETKEDAKETQIPEFDLEITYNGAKEKLTKEQAVELAQKGKDYDRIRPIYDFVKELAEDENKSVEEYVKSTSDNLKDYKIKQLAEEKDISEEVAKELYESRVAQRKSLASEKEAKAKNEAENKRNAEFEDFIKTYPNIKPNEIPSDVWNKVTAGTPLKYAYMEYEMEQIKNENSILKTNAKNKEQEVTTGTQATNKSKDIYEEAWDSAW